MGQPGLRVQRAVGDEFAQRGQVERAIHGFVIGLDEPIHLEGRFVVRGGPYLAVPRNMVFRRDAALGGPPAEHHIVHGAVDRIVIFSQVPIHDPVFLVRRGSGDSLVGDEKLLAHAQPVRILDVVVVEDDLAGHAVRGGDRGKGFARLHLVLVPGLGA